jgi:hypothetical protein
LEIHAELGKKKADLPENSLVINGLLPLYAEATVICRFLRQANMVIFYFAWVVGEDLTALPAPTRPERPGHPH